MMNNNRFAMNQCMICRDIKNAKNAERELNNALNYILRRTRILNLKEIDDKISIKYIKSLMHWTPSIHFMCGRCMKFDDNLLKRNYKKLCNEVIKIKAFLENNAELDFYEKAKIKREIFDIVRGRCPQLAQFVEKIKIEKNNYDENS